MISEKLLLEVLDYPNGIVNFGLYDNEVMVLSTTACHDDIYNVYELAHLCKVWAKAVGYMIESDNSNECRVYPTDENGWILKKEIEFIEDSEPEAIFKACEFILEREI